MLFCTREAARTADARHRSGRALLVVALWALAAAVQALTYKLTDLGDVGQELYGAQGVNDAGQVVGVTLRASDGNGAAFLWTASGGRQIIGLPNQASSANAVNAAGQVAGEGTFPSGNYDAWFWTAAGGFVDCGNLGGAAGASGRAINKLGHVAGGGFLNPFGEHAFLWVSPGPMQDLGGTASFCTAIGINDFDQICGAASGKAFVYTTALGFQTLGLLPGGTESAAYGINNAGVVVGEANNASGDNRPMYWSQFRGIVDLGSLGGHSGIAYAINNRGVIVGESDDVGGNQRAFVGTASGGIQDLNTLVQGGSTMVLTNAVAVSNSGLIVGRGLLGTQTHAFLLTPTVLKPPPPIPATPRGQ